MGEVQCPRKLHTWSIQRLVQGIWEGYFRGRSGLFRGDSGKLLEEQLREHAENYTQKNMTETNITNSNNISYFCQMFMDPKIGSSTAGPGEAAFAIRFNGNYKFV